MAPGRPRANRGAGFGRWVVMAAVVLGGMGFVFRHSLFPGQATHADEAGAVRDTAMTVGVITARRQPVSRRLLAGGTLVPREEVLVLAQVSGASIRSLLADVGDVVSEGQPLAVLDDARVGLLLSQNAADLERAQAALAQAAAMVEEAAAAREDSRKLLQRAVALRASGAVSERALEERRTAAETAGAREEAQHQARGVAKAELARVVAVRDELNWQREQLTIRAPAAGTITERNAKEGQTAGGEGSPMFRIAKAGEVEVEALVIETALPSIRPGLDVMVTIAGDSRASKGRVRLVLPTVDPSTRMGKVRVSLDEPALRPGSFASTRFDLNPHQAVVLPHGAVLGGGADTFVLAVRGDVVSILPVTTGLNTTGGIEIVEGLREGENVVGGAGGFLREGSRVRPVPFRDAGTGGTP